MILYLQLIPAHWSAYSTYDMGASGAFAQAKIADSGGVELLSRIRDGLARDVVKEPVIDFSLRRRDEPQFLSSADANNVGVPFERTIGGFARSVAGKIDAIGCTLPRFPLHGYFVSRPGNHVPGGRENRGRTA